MPVKAEINEKLSGTWKVGLFETPCKAPMQFCYGCCCSCCMAAQQRLAILDFIGEPYVCCGGMFPCGPLGQPQDRNCVWCEAFCPLTHGCAISGNRFYIHTRFDKANTACDDCILITLCLAHWVICILRCFIDVPDEIENCLSIVTCIVDGCMLAQQQVELEEQKKIGYQFPNPAIIQSLPPNQQGLVQQGKPTQMAMGGVGVGVPMAQGAGMVK